jgi:6-phosphogluconate dehydrogenase
MRINLIGLGKMGYNLALNLKSHGHEVIGYDVNLQAREKLAQEHVKVVDSLKELFLRKNDEVLVAWLLVPNQFVDDTIKSMLPLLQQGDIIIDGGNSNFNLSVKRFHELKAQGIHFVDVGTSGGTEGARFGASLMIGGEKETYEFLEPVYKDIAKPNGYAFMGAPGSGHFVKMVHNGIEYGMMQAIGEGFALMESSEFSLNYSDIARVWNNGSIIESSLIKNVESAFAKDSNLSQIIGRVDESGEALWMVEEALKRKVALPVITESLYARFKSKDDLKFSEKVVAAMRNEFGGHSVYKK